MRRLQTGGLAILLAVSTATMVTRAQEAPALQLVVTGAAPDDGGETLTITGKNFGAIPFVTLDLLPLVIESARDTQIVAMFPVRLLSPGKYLLTVSRGPSSAEHASFEMVLGAGEPEAHQAADGDQGPPIVTPGFSAGVDQPAAQVGERMITIADVDREWRRMDPGSYAQVTQRLYEARREVVEQLATNELLAREAAARGMTTDALLKEELPPRMIPLPEAALVSLYESLGDGTRGATLEEMRPALRAWLERRIAPDLAKLTYLNELMKTSTRTQIFLAPPRVQIERAAQDATLGSAAAVVELVAFGDFLSAEYAAAAQTFGRLLDTFGDRIRIVFKHLPGGQPAALDAAEAAQCAKAQGQFWAYHDALLARPGALDTVRLKQHASTVGLNREAFDACVDRGEFRALIQQAVQEAGRYGVEDSPSFLINGRLVPDPPPLLRPLEFLTRLIEEELLLQAREASRDRR